MSKVLETALERRLILAIIGSSLEPDRMILIVLFYPNWATYVAVALVVEHVSAYLACCMMLILQIRFVLVTCCMTHDCETNMDFKANGMKIT